MKIKVRFNPNQVYDNFKDVNFKCNLTPTAAFNIDYIF